MNYQDCLQAIAEGSTALEALLHQECELVAQQPDTQALQQLIEQKLALTATLNRLERQRQLLLSQHTEGGDELPANLLDSLRRCQQLNLRAGAHIDAQARYTGRALEVLGLGSGDNTYTVDGSRPSLRAGQALGKA